MTTAAAAVVGDCDWTDEKCLQLIKEYRARPILWDKNSPFHYNRQMRPDAWDEIGKAMNTNPDACKHKMGILMSSFRREKAKVAASIRNKDKKGIYKSNWFAFKDLVFCMEHSSGNVYTTDDDIFMSSLLKRTVSQPRQHQRITNEKPVTRGGRPKLTPMSVTQEAAIPQMPSDLPPLTSIRQFTQPTSDSEEIKSFATFIATKMKKFSESTKNAVQKEICEIIFKADQGFYDRPDDGDGSHKKGYYIRVRRFDIDDQNRGVNNEIVIKNHYSDDEN